MDNTIRTNEQRIAARDARVNGTDRLIDLVLTRLSNCPQRVSFGFEGSFFDFLLASILKEGGAWGTIETFCSVRPCMTQQHIKEVDEFARTHGLALVGYSGGCWIDKETGEFIVTQCSNVTVEIKRLRSQGFLTHLVANVSADYAPDEISRHAEGSWGPLNTESGVLYRDSSGYLLFPFMFVPDEVMVSAGMDLMPEIAFGNERFPTCALTCYQEAAIGRFRDAYTSAMKTG